MSKIKELLYVNEEEIRTVRSMYNKTEDNIQEDINLLIEWLKKQPHLPQHIERARLERFLLRNKFRIEQTKFKLDNYYSLKVFYSECYAHLDLDSQLMKNIRKSMVITPLPKLLPTLQRVIFFDMIEDEEENFHFLGFMRHIFIYWEFQLSHDYSVSDVFICNFKHLSYKHILKLDPNLIHKWFFILKNGYSTRFAQLHYVNVSPAVDALVSLLKRVLTAKLFKKIVVHENLDSLHEVVPKEYLPEEIEGNMGPAKYIRDKWVEEIIFQKEFLKVRAKETSNEKLRIGKSIYNDTFGVDGTFKKINVD